MPDTIASVPATPDPYALWLPLAKRGVTARLRAGQLEALPVIISLMFTWVIFQTLDHRFLTAANLSNMVVQIAAVGVMAIGITLVLLLGETDLSIGSVSGLAAAALAILVIRHDAPEVLAIALVVLLGLVIGTVHGTIRTAMGVPSFVVTLAGLIGGRGCTSTCSARRAPSTSLTTASSRH